MTKKPLALTLLAVVAIIAICVFASQRISAARSAAQKNAAGPRDTSVVVKTGRVELGSVKNILTFNGDIEAMRSVDLQSKVAGRLLALELEDGTPVEEGTRVKKGQQIGRIDDREYHAKLSSATAVRLAAEANVASAKATLEQRKAALVSEEANVRDKEREFERQKGLMAKNAGKQQDLDQAETAFAQAKADMTAAKAQISGAEAAIQQANASLKQAQAQEEEAALNYAETKIIAPMDGVVSKKCLDPGVQVTASTPLVTILEIDTVKVVVSVPTNRLSLIVPGKTQATLRCAAHPTERVSCVVEKVYPAVNSVTRTAQVEMRLENALFEDGTYMFLPGMYATVDLLMEERTGIVTVDVSLPIRNLDKQLVFVCNGDTVKAVPVNLGITTGGMVEVLDGLKEGDEIVVQGQHRLTDGATIKRVE